MPIENAIIPKERIPSVSGVKNCSAASLDQKASPKQLIEIRNIEGKIIEPTSNQLQFLIYENGSVEKNITLD